MPITSASSPLFPFMLFASSSFLPILSLNQSSPFPPSFHQKHFHLYEDYADFEDLLALVEEEVRMAGESRGKEWPLAGGGGPRQHGILAFDPSRKRRSEGRSPVATRQLHPPSSSMVRSGRIFPSPRIVERFKPVVEPGQIRVEASSLQREYPEWLALHAGGRRGPIRARSYRELLLHALNRAQTELSRRHRLYSAGEGPGRKKTMVDGESRKKKKEEEDEGKGKKAMDGRKQCRECFAHWRMLRATKGMSDGEVAEGCCRPGGGRGVKALALVMKGEEEEMGGGKRATAGRGEKAATTGSTAMPRNNKKDERIHPS